MRPIALGHTVTTLLERAVLAHAGAAAVVGDDGTEVTYAQWGERVAGLAGGLVDLGLGPGDRVVVAARNGPEFLLVDHALLWAGLVRVAVSFRLHEREVAAIAADCTAAAVVVDPAAAAPVAAALAERGAACPVIVTAGDPAPIDAALIDAALTVAALAASGTPVPPHSADPEDLAWMPYTSGTTGTPKGVLHTHRSIMACLRNLAAELPPVGPGDTLLQVAPMSHLAGWVGLLFAVRGARQVFMAEFDAAAALASIERHRVTVTPVVPTIVNLLTQQAEAGAHDVASLRTVIYAGSPIAPDRLARAIAAFGPVFVQCYGTTELPMPVAALSQHDHRLDADGTVPQHLGSAGRVTPCVEVRLVDPDGREVAPGEPGEIRVRGDMVMRGYWRRPDETAAFADDEGWCSTGDIGRLVDGYLYIVDRARDMIVTGGFNVFPSEVENVIATLPGVAEVAVVGVPDAQWGETVLAVVVPHAHGAVTAPEIDDACRAAIAAYKRPRRVEFVDALPRNATGKLLRRELRSGYWRDRARAVDG